MSCVSAVFSLPHPAAVRRKKERIKEMIFFMDVPFIEVLPVHVAVPAVSDV